MGKERFLIILGFSIFLYLFVNIFFSYLKGRERHSFQHKKYRLAQNDTIYVDQLKREVVLLRNISKRVEYVKNEIKKFHEYNDFGDEKVNLLSHVANGFLKQYVKTLHSREKRFSQVLFRHDRHLSSKSYSIKQLDSIQSASHFVPTNCRDKISKFKIGLVLPVTTKGYSGDYADSVFFKTFLPSLVSTATQGYHYTIFLGHNDDDLLFSNSELLEKLFQNTMSNILHHDCSIHGFLIDYKAIELPKNIVGSNALSILFAVPTLAAYHDGCDYFYLANDDLRLITPDWSSKFTDALSNNHVYPNLGIVGGEDISGPQPFLEFPFFHRTHIEIFSSFGAHPYVFRNWFEDNWINDVYLPFNSVFYLKDVKVANYEGLNVKGERYQVTNKDTPRFFVSEVENGRKRIKNWINDKLDKTRKIPTHFIYNNIKTGYCEVPGSSLSLMAQEFEQRTNLDDLNLDPCDLGSYIYDATNIKITSGGK